MLTDTLSAELRRYNIGEKIKALRLKKKLGLVKLGEHTGLSAAMLSKIERGQLFPTLPTLMRIALVFGVGLEHFFVEDQDRPLVAVVRKGERLRLPERSGENRPAYFFESLDYPVVNRKMESYLAEFPARPEPSEPHEHEGAELIYVVGGELLVNVGGEDIRLEAGDAMYFDGSAPHSYRCPGSGRCTALVVVAS